MESLLFRGGERGKSYHCTHPSRRLLYKPKKHATTTTCYRDASMQAHQTVITALLSLRWGPEINGKVTRKPSVLFGFLGGKRKIWAEKMCISVRLLLVEKKGRDGRKEGEKNALSALI